MLPVAVGRRIIFSRHPARSLSSVSALFGRRRRRRREGAEVTIFRSFHRCCCSARKSTNVGKLRRTRPSPPPSTDAVDRLATVVSLCFPFDCPSANFGLLPLPVARLPLSTRSLFALKASTERVFSSWQKKTPIRAMDAVSGAAARRASVVSCATRVVVADRFATKATVGPVERRAGLVSKQADGMYVDNVDRLMNGG